MTANPTGSVTSIPTIRRRLYGLCVLVALAVLLLVHITNNSLMSVSAYVPLIIATMLAMGLAGAEWQVAVQRFDDERRAQVAELDRSEIQAVERQHQFNQLWQLLADSRGKTRMPETAMLALGQLFTADLVAIWSVTEKNGGFQLRGVQPADPNLASRLDKIGQASPCFEKLRGVKHEIHVTDFTQDTSQALSIFCEEKNFHQAVFCPVLVREELVGVLVFFYQETPRISAKIAEEMQSAANLFLCAL